ncbi:Transcriptional activator of ethanol catabolism AlcS [Rasamsonia emersonii CBS 393.64]|uniref:Transcriptional activator of ethanol catabolism AlcS n=1 Tax=Rasamsonia emersonii (strain ATCC 16479 / CBS 393.64 / IMI 116815) TaxID=1408163 RepID=A0A0F4Z4W9_RASE3|nr:Transcriptional activator of ethanol catabolism AlcS [Rasamsonia emersonii CBS 393.64]KKA25567.1 Transcriptional activator of ethanol catabolism AlcS [Rasamsonia emersonii CBS 393.64]
MDSNSNSNGTRYDLKAEESREDAIRKIKTAGSLSISPELFEKIYLSPKSRVHGDLRSIVGNPTPLGVFGFIISLTPLSCDLMGWRGGGGGGAALIGAFYGIGGVLMPIAGILEFILGNTFSFVVFLSFGAFWLATGITMTPFYNAAGAYDPSNPANPGFHTSFAFIYVFMGLLCLIYLICGIRTNVVFEIIFLTLTLGFCLLAGSYWQLAALNSTLADNLQIAGGASFFVACLAGWYLFFVQMLASVDFPYTLPVGDLSRRKTGKWK